MTGRQLVKEQGRRAEQEHMAVAQTHEAALTIRQLTRVFVQVYVLFIEGQVRIMPLGNSGNRLRTAISRDCNDRTC